MERELKGMERTLLTLKISVIIMINQVVKGAMTYLKRPFILKFDENEPKVYKLQVVRGNVIKEDAIVAYAAQAAAVPESTIIMAKNALFDAINYFCANGRRVMGSASGHQARWVHQAAVPTSP